MAARGPVACVLHILLDRKIWRPPSGATPRQLNLLIYLLMSLREAQRRGNPCILKPGLPQRPAASSQ